MPTYDPPNQYIYRIVAVEKASGKVFESSQHTKEEDALQSAAKVQQEHPDLYSLEIQKATPGQYSPTHPDEPNWFRY